MKQTFAYRQKMVHDPVKSSEIFTAFSRFLDIEGMTGTSVQGHLDSITESLQPYLLAVGTQRSGIHKYFIVIDEHAIPCKSPDSLACFNKLLKAHFVFGTSYNQDLANVYNFLQTTIYEIDVDTTKVLPLDTSIGIAIGRTVHLGYPSSNAKVFEVNDFCPLDTVAKSARLQPFTPLSKTSDIAIGYWVPTLGQSSGLVSHKSLAVDVFPPSGRLC
ncbi:hypothetical protein F2P81_025323 [Scophthalmus maximus]|uniref:Uncharacterized protein n=1 Tax=Scophthalmus maximus TaxID=52904 RepID=A0A6A4RT87_SCOMX|nr:hypothetical protein F2P81_025323 [Scophthalmus maximus]